MFNILKTITNTLGFGIEKSEPESIIVCLKKKPAAVSYNDVENIIDVSENEPSKIIYVPNSEIKSKNIAPINIEVNQDFKHLYSQLSLVGRQIEWADRLQIPYKRKFLENSVNELQTFKLFIVLCDKTNDYLVKNYNFDLLQKLDKIAENSYYSYQDTLYTLFCISEFSMNYDKNFKSSPEFSFEVLAKQIDQNLVDQIKVFLYKDLELKDPESYFITNSQSSLNYSQPSSYINSYTLFDNSFKRLRFDLKTIYYVKVLDLSKNTFLEIDQCLDETIILYIKLILKIRDYHNSIEQTKEFVSKVCVTGPIKSNYGYYCFIGNEKTVSRFLTGIFKRAENIVRSQYIHSRMLDDSDFYKYNKSKLGEKLIKYLDEYCTEYITTKPNRATNIVLNKANRTKWKTEFNNILESKDDWETKFYKIDDLIDENCDNPSQNTIYLETAKKLAAFKTQELRQQSTWYYFNYSIKCYHNNTVYVVPSLDKILFNENKEIATEFFKIIEKTQNISPQNLITQKQIIFDLFVLKRKQLNLDHLTVSQIHNNYAEMVTELNSILQDESIDDKNLITKVEEENSKIITEINIVNKEPMDTSNLIDLKIVEQNLLKLMVNKKYKINFEEFSNFIIKNNISNSIIRTINKKFFEEFEENIIEIGEEVYFINPDNQQYLTQVL